MKINPGERTILYKLQFLFSKSSKTNDLELFGFKIKLTN